MPDIEVSSWENCVVEPVQWRFIISRKAVAAERERLLLEKLKLLVPTTYGPLIHGVPHLWKKL